MSQLKSFRFDVSLLSKGLELVHSLNSCGTMIAEVSTFYLQNIFYGNSERRYKTTLQIENFAKWVRWISCSSSQAFSAMENLATDVFASGIFFSAPCLAALGRAAINEGDKAIDRGRTSDSCPVVQFTLRPPRTAFSSSRGGAGLQRVR